jgi:hypothetical protein
MALSTNEAAAVQTLVDYLAGMAGVPRANIAGLEQPTPAEFQALNALATLAGAAGKTIHNAWQPHDVRQAWPWIRGIVELGSVELKRINQEKPKEPRHDQ